MIAVIFEVWPKPDKKAQIPGTDTKTMATTSSDNLTIPR